MTPVKTFSSSPVSICVSEMLVFKRGNLFEATCSLGHCVSQDLRMSRGIARQFRERFGRIPELLCQRARVGEIAVLQHDHRFLYYLVTKKKFYQKPTLYTVRSSLLAMREHMIAHGVQTAALPRVATGLDRVPWLEIKRELEEIFELAPLTVVVYVWED